MNRACADLPRANAALAQSRLTKSGRDLHRWSRARDRRGVESYGRGHEPLAAERKANRVFQPAELGQVLSVEGRLGSEYATWILRGHAKRPRLARRKALELIWEEVRFWNRLLSCAAPSTFIKHL